MDTNRPRGRERNVTGPAKRVEKRGSGLGTGPVGNTGGHSGGGPAHPAAGSAPPAARAG